MQSCNSATNPGYTNILQQTLSVARTLIQHCLQPQGVITFNLCCFRKQLHITEVHSNYSACHLFVLVSNAVRCNSTAWKDNLTDCCVWLSHKMQPMLQHMTCRHST